MAAKIRQGKVWEYDFWYKFFKPYVVWAVRGCYSRITVSGVENVPDPRDASVLFAPNHCNTLMDALVLLQTRKEPTSFVARADIFKNPFIAYILGKLRILPIYRKRDGVDTRTMNADVFDNVVDSLVHGVPLAIYPEGTHRPRRSLLPLKKGVLRIARQAAVMYPSRPSYIVPVGVTYADFFNIMRPVEVRFGEAVKVDGDVDVDLDLAVVDLSERMSKLFVCFPDDENLDAAEAGYEASRKKHYSFAWYLAALALLPVWLAAGVLCSPMIATSLLAQSKIRDRAWYNTARFVSKLFLTPLTVLCALIAGFSHLPWYGAVLLALATLYAHPVFYRILAFYRDLR